VREWRSGLYVGIRTLYIHNQYKKYNVIAICWKYFILGYFTYPNNNIKWLSKSPPPHHHCNRHTWYVTSMHYIIWQIVYFMYCQYVGRGVLYNIRGFCSGLRWSRKWWSWLPGCTVECRLWNLTIFLCSGIALALWRVCLQWSKSFVRDHGEGNKLWSR